MRRRTYITSSAVGLSGILAGCLDEQTEDDEEDEIESYSEERLTEDEIESYSEERLTEDEYPEIEWVEEWVSGSDYRLSVSVDFNGADEITFRAVGGVVLKELERSTHQDEKVPIAGEDTSYGLVESPTSINAEVDTGGISPMEIPVDTHMVGLDDQPSQPFHLTGLSGNTSPDLDDDEQYDRSFSFEYEGTEYQLSVTIPESLYNYYTERVRVNDRGAYVADPYQQPYLGTLADEFGDAGSQETINKMLAFVQQLPYTEDEVSAGIQQYTTYPLETLFDGGGDCEDTAILLLALMAQANYDTVLLAFRDEQHMALGVAGEEGIPGAYYEYEGTRYYYLETTAPGWQVGEVPPDLEGAKAEIQEIDTHPTLVFAWTTMPALEGEGVEVDIVVQNEGDVAARNTQVYAYFEEKSGQVVASEDTSQFTIDPSQDHEETISLVPPDDETLRCVMEAKIDAEVHDRAKSEWREPDEFMSE
ncbi:hypothetical protein [Natronobacterium gregoryi]|uniref:Copper amine oxidase n=2 Tax=Natronobacterium gregoryi TaxID=44930 RepID=L0AFR1_NATGS|nr:hypothetical protein [Natronobacterium gregoryi]AFZ72753.1 hypothetical protein Natgr_1547 [Natronobacterium gregoryi SP2]ELY69481.1 copper amine oxidase domain-containing protein [Natronobacterium gregoryi SP2]PLK21179.1 copper amine oxidase [Natronobacterium gregoryi SP2]SFJ68963.1 hypothetical protein SAMN05443661_15819 [Natronobacterium gregoryi]